MSQGLQSMVVTVNILTQVSHLTACFTLSANYFMFENPIKRIVLLVAIQRPMQKRWRCSWGQPLWTQWKPRKLFVHFGGSLNEQELLHNSLLGWCGVCYFIDIPDRCFTFIVNLNGTSEDTATCVKVISKSPVV